MSIHVSSAVWNTPVGDPLKKAILLKLADNANDDWECWPSIATIVRDTEISKPCVCKKLRSLEDEGWLTRDQRAYTSTKYYLNKAKFTGPKKTRKVVSHRDTPCLPQRQGSLPQRLGVVSHRDRNHQENPHLTIIEPSVKEEMEKRDKIMRAFEKHCSALNSSPSTPQKQVPKGG